LHAQWLETKGFLAVSLAVEFGPLKHGPNQIRLKIKDLPNTSNLQEIFIGTRVALLRLSV